MSIDDKDTPESSPGDDRRAFLWALLPRLILSAFTGGMLAMSLTAHPRAFWDGALIGVGAQVLIRGVVGLILRGRQDNGPGVVLSILAGAAVGGGVAFLAAEENLVSLTIVGGLVGVVDSVVSWVMFPSANRTPVAPDDADSDLQTPSDADGEI